MLQSFFVCHFDSLHTKLDTVKEDVTAGGDVDAPEDCLYVSGVTIKGRRIFSKAMFTAIAGLTT